MAGNVCDIVPGGRRLIKVMGILCFVLSALLLPGSRLTGLPCDLDLILVPVAVGLASLYVAWADNRCVQGAAGRSSARTCCNRKPLGERPANHIKNKRKEQIP